MERDESVTSKRRIVEAFLDFLHSVEGDADVDAEALEVARDCLREAFQTHLLPPHHRPPPNLLLSLFADQTPPSAHHPHPPPPLAASNEDELFGHFIRALDNSHFFDNTNTTHQDVDEEALLETATSLFLLALHESQSQSPSTPPLIPDTNSLADALKLLGNKSMHSNSYSDAVQRYTCAIALNPNNAVYYSNRAAAYTQMLKYDEAITDCLKSVEIDPGYSKAYSRMGLAYYAQGKYSDAINKGFTKALELDPNNDAVKENIRVAEHKLTEEREQRNRFRSSGFNFGVASEDGTASSSGFGSIPANLASMFGNLAGNASQNQTGQGRAAEENNSASSGFVDGNSFSSDIAGMVENIARTFRGQDSENTSSEQSRPMGSVSVEAGAIPSDIAGMFMNMNAQSSDQGSNVGGSAEPERARGANFSFNLGGQTPEELNRAFSSMMGMFPGGDRRGNSDSR